MMPCSLFIQRADSVFSPVSTAVPLSDVKNFSTAGGTNPTQTGDAVYDYCTPKQKAQIAKHGVTAPVHYGLHRVALYLAHLLALVAYLPL